jgi:hypothetical protein
MMLYPIAPHDKSKTTARLESVRNVGPALTGLRHCKRAGGRAGRTIDA